MNNLAEYESSSETIKFIVSTQIGKALATFDLIFYRAQTPSSWDDTWYKLYYDFHFKRFLLLLFYYSMKCVESLCFHLLQTQQVFTENNSCV